MFKYRCEIPCPRDCQVGPWSEWSPCMPPKCPAETENDLQDGMINDIFLKYNFLYLTFYFTDIERNGFRKRTRPVLIPPSEYGVQCPSLSEIQPCQNPQCYIWDYDQWGSCMLDDPSEKCGTGQRNRQVYCTTHEKVQ